MAAAPSCTVSRAGLAEITAALRSGKLGEVGDE
jgi:hypothetical protein